MSRVWWLKGDKQKIRPRTDCNKLTKGKIGRLNLRY